ncbi:MAG: hypothetical protein JST31_05090 [Actinobacteria bacterium]|nr:hypothetical protein [Actinomycetota bacterium]
MAIARAALLTTALAALALILVSGGSDADPRTPPALPGLPPPFLGTTVTGDGGLTAAVDAYGDMVDLRPGPAGPALIDNPSARQAAGTVPAATGIVPRLRFGDGPVLPLWRADAVRQRYLAGTNVVRTAARFGPAWLVLRTAASGGALAMVARVRSPAGLRAAASVGVNVAGGARCREQGSAGRGMDAPLELLCWVGMRPEGSAAALLARAGAADRRWVARARPLGPGAPAWARAMYERSLLVLRALTDARTGAVAAGARDGWAYVWPRDAATAALAYAAAGYRGEARRVAGFLAGLGTRATEAARFDDRGMPVPGRGPQGDAAGWIAAAANAAATAGPSASSHSARPANRSALDFVGAMATQKSNARDLPDYQEGSPGAYLGNAIASGEPAASIAAEFETRRGLVRVAGDPSSGLDSAAAWAVRPFSSPALYPAARRTLLRLASHATAFGITPGEAWSGGSDPWTAPTAWSAWSLAALGDRAAALTLLADLHRAATPAGALPERVGARTGIPRSTTPLAWSHAFAILALRQLWPGRWRP